MSLRLVVGRLLAFFAGVALLTVGTTAVAGDLDGDWIVDGDRSEIRFVSDAPMERFTGTSDQIEGTVTFDPDNPSATTGEIKFPVDSVKTGNSTRDRHLTQDDWLAADDHPDVRFEIGDFKDIQVAESEDRLDYRGTAEGTVELRGNEQSETADVEIAVLPDQNLARIQFELDFALQDYGVEGTRDRGIGSNVGEAIDVEGTIYADTE